MTAAEEKLVQDLKDAGALVDGKIKRFRLFTQSERYTILDALPGHSAMIGEIEMLNFSIAGDLWPQ